MLCIVEEFYIDLYKSSCEQLCRGEAIEVKIVNQVSEGVPDINQRNKFSPRKNKTSKNSWSIILYRLKVVKQAVNMFWKKFTR